MKTVQKEKIKAHATFVRVHSQGNKDLPLEPQVSVIKGDIKLA